MRQSCGPVDHESELVDTYCFGGCPVGAQQQAELRGVDARDLPSDTRLCPAMAIATALDMGNEGVRRSLSDRPDDYVSFRLGQGVDGTEGRKEAINTTAAEYRQRAGRCAASLMQMGEDTPDPTSLRTITPEEITERLAANLTEITGRETS